MIAKLTEDSQRDLLRGIDWFERISPGLGDRFTSVVYFRMDGDLIIIEGLFTSGEDETDLMVRR